MSEKKGNGTMKITFDENNKEQKQKKAENIVNSAIADGINASYTIEENEFVITLPGVPVSMIKKYNDMLDRS
jgi:hypothetical protein